MTDIEHQIANFLREEADRASLSDGVYQRVLRRAKLRRVVTATIAGAAAIAIVVAGVVAAGALRSPSTIGPAGPEGLPAPPGSLRGQLPDELDGWVRPGLVLVYERGGIYQLFSEGVMPHSCPPGTPERNPEACFSTAQHVVWDRAAPDAMSVTSSHDLRIAEPPVDAEVLWTGFPDEGSIGVRSPDACARIERFEGYYECTDGMPVYARGEDQEDQEEGTAEEREQQCPVLLRPGPQARQRAEAAARRWAEAQEGMPSGTRFEIEVVRATGTPKGGCFPRRIANREQTWRRTWVANVFWRYPKGSGLRRSASLASSTIFLGRTPEGWQMYFQFH
jgi:hypothetical protein